MKRIILVSLFFIISHSLYSWDSTAAKYLPLQVGNIWVYYSTYSFQIPPFLSAGYFKYRITGITDSLGSRYYVLEETHVGGGCGVYDIKRLRIDSTTMNIYYGATCYQKETLRDSLMAELSDTSWNCWVHNYFNYSIFIDTSLFNIFGQSIPSKRFQGRNNGTTYLKDIGIGSWGYSEAGNSCSNILRGCVINGIVRGDTSMLVGIKNISTEIPESFSLSQNYPNPFNPKTKIRFDIPSLIRRSAGVVVLKVYDVLGREVQTLVNEQLSPGTYEVEWDGTNYPSGVYHYILTAGEFKETKRMVLVR